MRCQSQHLLIILRPAPLKHALTVDVCSKGITYIAHDNLTSKYIFQYLAFNERNIDYFNVTCIFEILHYKTESVK